MTNLNEALKNIKLNHDEGSIQGCFGIDDDKVEQFSRTMAQISHKMEDMPLSEIIEHVIDKNEINTLNELICTMFVAGMGIAEAKHKTGLDNMRNEVIDMALTLKEKNGNPINPSDFISAEQIQQVFNESDGEEF